MDQREVIAAVQNYLNNVSQKYELVQAFVFGSYAKGHYHSDSDIDVAIVLKNVHNLFDVQIDLLHLRKDEDLQIEPHPFRDTDFHADDPFVNEILQTGFELKVAV